MNSLPPLSLPRFHVNELSRPHKAKNASVQAQTQEQAFSAPPEEQQESLTEQELEATPVSDIPVAPILPEIDTGAILNSLETAKAGLERQALTHSQTRIMDFLQTAFPSLCEAFLAEEVTRTLSKMAPSEINTLVIKVPEAFEAAFQRVLQSAPEMSERYALEVIPGREEILIDVDWQSGGLQFDMQHFLESSLARLSGSNQTQEGHNV